MLSENNLVSYIRSHLGFVYNLLVTNLSVQIYATYIATILLKNYKTTRHTLPLFLRSPADLYHSLHYIYSSMLLDITSSDAVLYAIPRCQARTTHCRRRYNLALPYQCTANTTYNLAAVVDIRLINHHLQIGIGR